MPLSDVCLISGNPQLKFGKRATVLRVKKKKKKGLFRLIYTRYNKIRSQFPPLKSYEGRVSFQISLVHCSRSHCLKNVESFKKKKKKKMLSHFNLTFIFIPFLLELSIIQHMIICVPLIQKGKKVK